MNTYVNTSTNAYTKTRIMVIDYHFELFLTCAGIPESTIAKFLGLVESRKIDAIGVYIEDGGYRILEVELEIDWDIHQHMIGCSNTKFDTDLGGWKNGVSPEAYIYVQRLVSIAKKMDKKIHSWIKLSKSCRDNPVEAKKICEDLGYSYTGKVSPWKNETRETKQSINYLPEATLYTREI